MPRDFAPSRTPTVGPSKRTETPLCSFALTTRRWIVQNPGAYSYLPRIEFRPVQRRSGSTVRVILATKQVHTLLRATRPPTIGAYRSTTSSQHCFWGTLSILASLHTYWILQELERRPLPMLNGGALYPAAMRESRLTRSYEQGTDWVRFT